MGKQSRLRALRKQVKAGDLSHQPSPAALLQASQTAARVFLRKRRHEQQRMMDERIQRFKEHGPTYGFDGSEH